MGFFFELTTGWRAEKQFLKVISLQFTWDPFLGLVC